MKKEITNLNELILAYRDEALSIDFERDYPIPYKIYHLKKLKLDNAESKDEKDEIINEIQKAIGSLKHDLLNVIMNEHYKFYFNGTPTFVSRISLYLMYNELLPAERLEPQKPEFENPYPNIFKGAGYVLWQRMFEDFKVTESSRTDVRFMFEALKNDGYIYDNIGEANIRDWINRTYDYAMEKLPFTSPKFNSNKNRLALYQSIKSNL